MMTNNGGIETSNHRNTSGVIILGSARSDGNTRAIVDEVVRQTGYDLVDLNDWQIGFFDYDASERQDDFLPLIRRLLNYDQLVFATPVYWYAMSGLMKNFFDRITDLLKWHKSLGKKLRGKKMALISCGSNAHIEEAFEMPFVNTAAYLGMIYSGSVHTWQNGDSVPNDVIRRIQEFSESLDRASE